MGYGRRISYQQLEILKLTDIISQEKNVQKMSFYYLLSGYFNLFYYLVSNYQLKLILFALPEIRHPRQAPLSPRPCCGLGMNLAFIFKKSFHNRRCLPQHCRTAFDCGLNIPIENKLHCVVSTWLVKRLAVFIC